MSFGGFSDNRQPAPMAEINVTPMVDVMLVLLVIFILAAPLFTHTIKLDLPQAAATPAPTQPLTITLSIDAAGAVFWNDVPLPMTELAPRMAQAASQVPAPDLQLRADRATRYEVIAQVMAAAQSNGLNRIGFVTDPQASLAAASAPAPQEIPAASSTLQLKPASQPSIRK
ncbi:MAG: biopolymer transporter ExbD [Herminiimonas sp.]|nr:biopolymer transporter ExbD [Herminiimonas sp.]